MTTYYVATNGSDSGKGTSGSPWKTISKAMKANLKPGDEVVVKSGTYKEAVVINKDGNAGSYITLRAEVPGTVTIDTPSGKAFGIQINANYVKVNGFEVEGGSKFGIGGSYVHHVQVTNNESHHNGAGGISFSNSDFITIEGNVAYNNASTGYYSGISVHLANNLTKSNASGYRNIVRDNVSYNNLTKSGGHTDGNGIIIDDFQAHRQAGRAGYSFPTLVEGNIVYSNGGRGIQVAYSNNVTVRDNIAWRNNTDDLNPGTWRGEISNQSSDNNTWIGNVAVTDKSIHKSNTAIANVGDSDNITWKNNTTFSGKQGDASLNIGSGNSAPSASSNNLGKDPGLSLSELKAMAGKLGASVSTSSQKVVVDSASADGDTGNMVAPEKTTDKVLVGKAGNDNLAGGAGNDKITGNAGNDKLTGNAGNDKLFGNAGNDKLFGGAGADTLDGGNGKDVLQGGTGKDVLLGGGGADDFVFKSVAEAGKGGGRDVIRDFSHGQGDDIHLAAIDANSKVAGNQAFSFIGEKAFSGKAGQLQYKNGLVAGDVNGDKVADFHIEIANHAALHANDFIL